MTALFVAPRVPLVDTKTGLCNPIWYRFFSDLFTSIGGGGIPDSEGFLVAPQGGLDAFSLSLADDLNSGGLFPPDSLPASLTDLLSLDVSPAPSGDWVYSLSFDGIGLTPATPAKGNITVGGTLLAGFGGTGQSSYTAGDMLYATGATALSKLAIGTTDYVLTSNGTAPVWSQNTGTGNVMRAASPTTTGTLTANIVTAGGLVSSAAGMFVSGNSTPTSGQNLELRYVGGGLIIAYDRTGAAYQPMLIQGSTQTLSIGTAPRFQISAASAITFPGIATTASAANAFLDSAASNQLLRSTSSLAYKTDVEPADDAHVMRSLDIDVIWYRSTASHDNPSFSYWGVAAEQAAQIDPRFVFYGFQEDQMELVETVTETPVYEQPVDENGDPIADAEPVLVRTDRDVRSEWKPRKGEVVRPDGAQYERINLLRTEALKRQNAALEARIAALEAKVMT